MLSIQAAFAWLGGIVAFILLWTPLQLTLQRRAESWAENQVIEKDKKNSRLTLL